MFLSLCARPEKRQLGCNVSKKALFEEPRRFDSFLTFSTGLGGAIWKPLLRAGVPKPVNNFLLEKCDRGLETLPKITMLRVRPIYGNVRCTRDQQTKRGRFPAERGEKSPFNATA